MSPYRDGDAKCLVVQMPSNGHVMMQMFLSGCHDANVPSVGMPWCECPLGSMLMMRMYPWWCNECECPFMGISRHKCFDANTIYSKIPFIFKIRLPQRLKPKYFQTQFIIPEKSSSFWLKAPKKLVITVRKSLNGAFTWNLMIWLKRLISTIWLSKEMVQFHGLFWKNEFFENQVS